MLALGTNEKLPVPQDLQPICVPGDVLKENATCP